jgi:general secretion pathway protein D
VPSKLRTLLPTVLAATLAACAADTATMRDAAAPAPPVTAQARPPAAVLESGPSVNAKVSPPLVTAEVVHGAETISRPRASAAASQSQDGGDFTFNFENVEIKDVVKAVLGDMLQLNYSVAPAIQGTMTLHTSRPMSRAAVLPNFEAALRLAGVALVAGPQGYELLPLPEAVHRAGLALPQQIGLAPGFRLELVPLKFVSATEIQHVLEPVSQPGTIVRVDPVRNVVLLAGTEAELANLLDTIAIFDVDWLKTQSFGLYPLHFASAKSVATELGQVIGPQTPLAGLVRIVPIDRLNAILVVSPRAAYVDEMRGWVERFDRGGDKPDARLYVYHVQNGNAEDLAGVLGKVIGQPKSAGSSATGAAAEGAGSEAQAAPASLATPALLQPAPGAGAGAAAQGAGEPRITADAANNALLIMATPAQYKVIEEAIDQLDTIPLQVMVEASVAEVTLTKDLSYGVQSFFKNGPAQTLLSQAAPPLGLSTGGLSFAFTRGTSINAVLDLLSTVSTVKVLSAPTVIVLNNHTASLDVGNQIPVATASAVSVQAAQAPVVNTIQQQITGIILKVTPRVNQGGLVQMDLSQEVSEPVILPGNVTSSIQSPTIQERKIETTVAVQDGQTLALGGLISDNVTSGITGVPWLSEVPVVGSLFGTTNDSITRSEIIVLVTPHVVRDAQSAAGITDELRTKLPLTHVFDGTH